MIGLPSCLSALTSPPPPTPYFCRSTKIGLDTIMDDNKFKHTIRKTKIICTAGPACWSETMLGTVFISRHWDTLTAWTFASCLGNPARV